MLLFSSGEKNNQKIVDGNLKLKVIIFQKNLPQFFINNDVVSTRTILEDDFLILDFYAQTFLWHQIRRIMSALIKIGMSKLEKDQIIEALYTPNKKFDFGLAPAEPLILKDIFFDFDFEYDKKQLIKLTQLEKKIISYF